MSGQEDIGELPGERMCWELLMSVLSAAHPTGLGESLRLTRIAEDLQSRRIAPSCEAGSDS
ncbi:MAG: hypothetical protein ACWA44_05805 [Thiotrichales bacterium]